MSLMVGNNNVQCNHVYTMHIEIECLLIWLVHKLATHGVEKSTRLKHVI
jgi:hypothetical protein